jgi:hypothetical protein
VTLYLLHFSRPYVRVQHYLGFTPDASIERRVGEHLACNGKASPLIKAAIGAGIGVSVAHQWPGGTRTDERRIKNRKDIPRWCPACGQNKRPIPTCEGQP